MNIETCTKEEQDYLVDRLVEYNLTQVETTQKENFIDLSRKIVENGKIIAGIIARMYCWNVVYVDTLWVEYDILCVQPNLPSTHGLYFSRAKFHHEINF